MPGLAVSSHLGASGLLSPSRWFQQSQTFPGLSEGVREELGPVFMAGQQPAIEGAVELVKGWQWHLLQWKNSLLAALLPSWKGQDGWASGFCKGGVARGEQTTIFSLPLSIFHI